MIFLGDIASPTATHTKVIEKCFLDNPEVFSGEKIICNFEGLIYDGPCLKSNEPLLYNHSSILKVLNLGKRSVLCLANNHVLDMPRQFESTIKLINNEGHLYCGAGRNFEEAENPVVFVEESKTFAIFNFCWNFLLYNHRNPSSGIYVAELNELNLIDKIKDLKKKSPEITIIVYIHWSLDLETLPFPMYRQFSKAIIDSGADLVIGSHSHCVQGGEKHGNGYILYGLGNFFIPNDVYAGGNLKFPDFTNTGLALEWDIINNKIICHWFNYTIQDFRHKLDYTGSEEFLSSERLNAFSPFTGMSEKKYIEYFKKNRRKKKLIPVYTDYKKVCLNNFYTRVLKTRARTAHFLAKLKFIKWQN